MQKWKPKKSKSSTTNVSVSWLNVCWLKIQKIHIYVFLSDGPKNIKLFRSKQNKDIQSNNTLTLINKQSWNSCADLNSTATSSFRIWSKNDSSISGGAIRLKISTSTTSSSISLSVLCANTESFLLMPWHKGCLWGDQEKSEAGILSTKKSQNNDI